MRFGFGRYCRAAGVCGWVLLAACAAIGGELGWAWIDGPPDTYGGVGITGLSSYVWRAFERSDDWVAQGSAWAGIEGVTGSVLATWDSDVEEFIEAQFSGECRAVTESGSFALGYTYYEFPEGAAILHPRIGKDPSSTQEVFLDATVQEGPYETSFQVYHDWDEGTGTYGVMVVSADEQFLEIPVRLDASVGYNHQMFWPDSGFSDIQVGISLPFSFKNDQIAFVPMLRYSFALDDYFDDLGFGGASLMLNF